MSDNSQGLSHVHDAIQPVADSYNTTTEEQLCEETCREQEADSSSVVVVPAEPGERESPATSEISLLSCESDHALLSNDPVKRDAKWLQLIGLQKRLESESLAEGAKSFRRRLERAEEKGRNSTVGAAKKLLTHGIAPTEEAIKFFVREQKAKRGVRHCAVKWLDMLSAHSITMDGGEKRPYVVRDLEGEVTGRFSTEAKAQEHKLEREAMLTGADTAAFMAVRCTLDHIGQRSSVRDVALSIVGLMLDELRFRRFEAKAPGLFKYKLNSFNTSSYVHMARSMSAAMRFADVDVSDLDMPMTQRLLLGTKLIDLVMQATGLFTVEMQTKVISRRRKGAVRRDLLIVPTEETRVFMEKRNSILEFLSPTLMPMVVPPLQWEPGRRGGYRFALRNKVQLVRGSQSQTKHAEASDMPMVYATVNAIQNTAWQINRDVLALVEELADKGLSMGKLPTAEREPMPNKPADIASNEEARKEWRRKAHAVKEKNHIRDNRALELSRVLTTATRLKGHDAIFFPHNMDFRGRIYPISHFLTPQGDDLQKALLKFAQGKPLGPDGSAYLALHGANCMGVTPQGRKVSTMTLDERTQWIVDNSAEICAVANDPLGYKWWADTENPLMFFAFCVEWDNYMELAKEGRGHEYVCALPVSIDGTCNGLQHFSAMLKDPIGARAVNVSPNSRPEDVYQRVAEAVKDDLEAIAASEAPTADLAAKWLASGLVNRSLTKRPTMTFSYGSKHYGFQEQLVKYMTELDNWREACAMVTREKDVGQKPKKAIEPACSLMAGCIWTALQREVVGAFQLMEWMQKCARMISKTGKAIEWIVPITGFYVRQEYFVTEVKQVKTVLAGRVVQPCIRERTNEVQQYKQANAVSPNVVHSLDAAGLMLTVTQSVTEGVEAFAAVHDSYGTLPADMGIVWRAARQSFVHLYTSHDVIGNLTAQFQAQAPEGGEIPAPPPLGTLDVSSVVVSDYFFC